MIQYQKDGEILCKECVDTRVEEDTNYYQDNAESLRSEYMFIITLGGFTCEGCDEWIGDDDE